MTAPKDPFLKPFRESGPKACLNEGKNSFRMMRTSRFFFQMRKIFPLGGTSFIPLTKNQENLISFFFMAQFFFTSFSQVSNTVGEKS